MLCVMFTVVSAHKIRTEGMKIKIKKLWLLNVQLSENGLSLQWVYYSNNKTKPIPFDVSGLQTALPSSQLSVSTGPRLPRSKPEESLPTLCKSCVLPFSSAPLVLSSREDTKRYRIELYCCALLCIPCQRYALCISALRFVAIVFCLPCCCCYYYCIHV